MGVSKIVSREAVKRNDRNFSNNLFVQTTDIFENFIWIIK